MHKLMMTVLLTLAAFLLVACGGDDARPTATPAVPAAPTREFQPPAAPTELPVSAVPEDLIRYPWQWMSFRDAVEAFEIQSPQSYVLTFNWDRTVSVRADCNTASGVFSAGGGRLVITLGPMTQAACAPGSRSDQFINLVQRAAAYYFERGYLVVELMLDGGTMVFAPAQPIAVQPTLAPPTPVPFPTAIPIPPTATPGLPVNLPSLPGSVIDRGPRPNAMGVYQAPYYIVAAGDTLFSIAQRFGVTVARIVAANALGPNGAIFPNQRLIISDLPGAPSNLPSFPGASADRGPRQHAMGIYQAPYYTVAQGDTIFSIGQRFGVSVQQMLAANGLDNNYPIFPGQRLIVPTAGEFERVVFVNSILATRNGVTNVGQPKAYVLGARAGQTMEINTQSSGVPLAVTVQAPGGAVLLLNGQNQQVNNVLYVSLPETGDYYVTVSPTTLPEGPGVNFSITFVIQ